MKRRTLAPRLALSTALMAATPQLFALNTAQTISIDVAANRHVINPNIYGVSYATTANLNDLNVGLNRSGGNNTSRYNWQLNADNKGRDWYFESIGDASAVAGARADTFITNSEAANAQAMITIPMIPYVAKLGASRAKLWSFSIAKYGAQTGNDTSYVPDAGNGISTAFGNPYITGNDPLDADIANSPALQLGWMQHLTTHFGAANAGGLAYYIMDNESSIWFATHRDVQPTGATMDAIYNDFVSYAGNVKANDPTARVVGPEEWGWTGYFYSGYDQQYGAAHGWGTLPDRIAHGNMDYMPWLLQNLKAYEVANGTRLLDVFSLHYYPQGGEFSNDDTAAMQLVRNRSTRSLWDPAYTDTSWIAANVQLIPRMKNWVATCYPGLQTGITEYNWGDEAKINGATTQADILGIFGREGLDMATRWTVPASTTPTYKAMKMYRNYDGAKSTFGDTSVSCTVQNPDNLSAFAAQRTSDGALTVMVINKSTTATTAVLNLSNFQPTTTCQRWRLTSSNAITHLADLGIGVTITDSAPAQSVTLYVFPQSAPGAPAVPQGLLGAGGNCSVSMSWIGSRGATSYNIYGSTTSGGEGSVPIETGITTTNYYEDGLAPGATYYYTVTAVNAYGESAQSGQASATTDPAPTVATAAKSTPAIVTALTSSLSVLGADNDGAAKLTYIWTPTTVPSGAASPTFSINGSNAAKNTVVTYKAAGAYTFLVAITEANGQSTSSSVNVTVNQTVTSVTVAPPYPVLAKGASLQFSATMNDQFGRALATQPTFTWTATGGTITAGGLYTAKTVAGTAYQAVASASGKSGKMVIVIN